MARLSKAPVCFTLAQMRFNPVLGLNSVLPALQDAFRKAGYPDFTTHVEQGLEVQQDQQDQQNLSISPRTVSRYVFRNKAQTAAFLLDENALTYELTAYPVFTEFSSAFLEALDIVHLHRPIEYTDRLGMRMLDAMQPMGEDTLEQYVIPQALGFVGAIDAGLDHQQSLTQSIFTNGLRSLVVRTVRIPNGAHAPADLMPLRLKFDQRFLMHQGETLMLDCDSFMVERLEYSKDAVQMALGELKAALSSSFKKIVTPYALDVWK